MGLRNLFIFQKKKKEKQTGKVGRWGTAGSCERDQDFRLEPPIYYV